MGGSLTSGGSWLEPSPACSTLRRMCTWGLEHQAASPASLWPLSRFGYLWFGPCALCLASTVLAYQVFLGRLLKEHSLHFTGPAPSPQTNRVLIPTLLQMS